MLVKHNRLSRGSEILKTLRKGKIMRSRSLSVNLTLNGSAHPRCAFIISRKVDLRATKRNQIKRRLSTIVEKAIKDGALRQVDMVVRIKPTTGLANPSRLGKELSGILHNVSVKAMPKG